MKHGKPEEAIQKLVVQYLRIRYPKVLFTSTQGGMRVSIGQAVNMKRCGYLNGVPDLLIFKKRVGYEMNSGLAIELKSENGRVSDTQKEVMADMALEGWKCVIAYSFDEAKQAIDEYLKV